MKRQPITSAAAFFVLSIVGVEIHRRVVESGGMSAAPTDLFFERQALY